MNLFEKYHIEKNGIKFNTKKLCRCGQTVKSEVNVCPHCGLSLKRGDLIFKTSYQKQIEFETDTHFRAYMLDIDFAKETVDEKKLWNIPLNLTLKEINDKLVYRCRFSLFEGNNHDKEHIIERLFRYIENSDMKIHYINPDRYLWIDDILRDIILYNADSHFFQYEVARAHFYTFNESFMEKYNLLKANFDFSKMKFDEEYISYMFGYIDKNKSLESLKLTLEEQKRFVYIYYELHYHYANHSQMDLYSPKEILELCHTWFDNPMNIEAICLTYSKYLDTEYTLYKIPEEGLTLQFMSYVINNWELVKKLDVSIEEADEYLKDLHDNPLHTLQNIQQFLKEKES